MLRSTDAPFRVTDDNMAQVQRRHPGLMIFTSKSCPACRSYLVGWRFSGWDKDVQGNRVSHSRGVRVICPYCRRVVVEDAWVPDNDAPPQDVAPNAAGWVRCPNCGTRFGLSSGASWDGERHRSCGQRLIIRAV